MITAPMFLKFPDQATFLAEMQDAGWVRITEEGPFLLLVSETHTIDIIGVIRTPPTFDDEAHIVDPGVELPGWHINCLGEVPDSWSQYAIHPKNPVRLFAGIPAEKADDLNVDPDTP